MTISCQYENVLVLAVRAKSASNMMTSINCQYENVLIVLAVDIRAKSASNMKPTIISYRYV